MNLVHGLAEDFEGPKEKLVLDSCNFFYICITKSISNLVSNPKVHESWRRFGWNMCGAISFIAQSMEGNFDRNYHPMKGGNIGKVYEHARTRCIVLRVEGLGERCNLQAQSITECKIQSALYVRCCQSGAFML